MTLNANNGRKFVDEISQHSLHRNVARRKYLNRNRCDHNAFNIP